MRKQNKFFKNEVGKKYNRLLVIEKSINDKYGNTKWKCKCDCGNIVEVIGTSLRNGSTKSCGCLLKDAMFKRRTGNSVYNIILNNIKSD